MKDSHFVFLNDVDFLPTPDLYASLTGTGRWGSELARMRDAWHGHRHRRALVLPAFERLNGAWTGACGVGQGCEVLGVRRCSVPVSQVCGSEKG